jgi:hypothetical protein
MQTQQKINEMLTSNALDAEYADSVPADQLLFVYVLLLRYQEQITNFIDGLEDRMREEGF